MGGARQIGQRCGGVDEVDITSRCFVPRVGRTDASMAAVP